MLRAEQIEVAYGREGRAVISGLDLALGGGGLTALVGPNGAGKSTLIKVFARALTPQAGRVLLDGTPLAAWSPRAVARRVAYVPQSPTAPEGLTVRALVAQGRQPHRGRWRRDPAALTAVDAALAEVGLAELAQRPVARLSGGEQRRAWIALALAQAAPIVLLDEPVAHLDPRHRLEVMACLRRLADAGRTVVAVLHEVGLAARFADRVVGLRAGRVVFDGPPRVALTGERLGALYDVRATVTDGADGLQIAFSQAMPATARATTGR